MREILFRGKRLDNGEWVEGYYVFERDTTYRSERHEIFSGINDYDDIYGRDRLHRWEVAPETVGQYTGLTDKNGKRIFEGDIVREVWGENVCHEHFVVCADSKRCGWFPFACGDGCGCCENDVWLTKQSEVIGNVHDNPELLEAKE